MRSVWYSRKWSEGTRLFSKLGVRNLDGYRMKIADEPGAAEILYFIVIIDELADLTTTSPDDVEGVLCRLAQMGRASGIHLILADATAVRGCAHRLDQSERARARRVRGHIVDGQSGGVYLPAPSGCSGRGDMLFLPPDAAKPVPSKALLSKTRTSTTSSTTGMRSRRFPNTWRNGEPPELFSGFVR